MSSEKRVLASTYIVGEEILERWRGHFRKVTVFRGILPAFRTEQEFVIWLKKRRVHPGRRVMITRTQAYGESSGFHKIVEGLLSRDGQSIIILDACVGSSHSGAKARPYSKDQPYWQTTPKTAAFKPKPEKTGG